MVAMDKAAIISTLRAHREELERAGIAHAALFGSHARGDARADSDIDILIDVEPERIRTVYDYVGLKLLVGDLFEGEVDVIERNSLRESAIPRVARDLIVAF